MTSDGAEAESGSNRGPDRSSEAAGTGGERRAVPDHEQEPGDSHESPAGMDGSGGRDAAGVPANNRSPARRAGTQTTPPGDKTEECEAEAALKLCEPGESHARSSLARSSESAQEQRDGENVFSSAPSEPGKTPERVELGTKRRASVERTSSDGEPLSRMDSEDRLVKVVPLSWELPVVASSQLETSCVALPGNQSSGMIASQRVDGLMAIEGQRGGFSPQQHEDNSSCISEH